MARISTSSALCRARDSASSPRYGKKRNPRRRRPSRTGRRRLPPHSVAGRRLARPSSWRPLPGLGPSRPLFWSFFGRSRAHRGARPHCRAIQKFDAATVPLVSDEMRGVLAAYPRRPDVKALALASDGVGVADGAPNSDSAKQEALRQCSIVAKRLCRIYAVGMDVVWSKEALPLPVPTDLHVEPLDIPLVPDEIPIFSSRGRQDVAERYMKSANPRALAFTAGVAWFQVQRASREEAVRMAVEHCSVNLLRPCLILSVDGFLTIQIPKTRRVVRTFLPSTEAEIPELDRERIAQIYQGREWRALARGKKGTWHPVAAAASEAAAIDAAINACSQADGECRLYAIGNFRVADD